LVVEAVYSHAATEALEVCRRIRVPEVWVCDKTKLIIKVRQKNGQYADSMTSASFPFLTAAEIFQWIDRPQINSETDWLLEVRRWVADVLVPRYRDAGPP
jgi:hypothetical protein